MQTNRKYLNRVYTSANKPQWIKPIKFNEAVSLKALLSGVYGKINEVIEALPNNWPVLIDVDMQHTAKQIKVEGSVFLDFNKVELNETLSIENDGYTGLLYVNLLNDRFRPVLEISPKFMEPNWTTLYVLNVVSGNIQSVVYNDIYAGMHESDPNAHKELFDELREYIDAAIDAWFGKIYREYNVFSYNRDGAFPETGIMDLDSIVPELQNYMYLDCEFKTASGLVWTSRVEKPFKDNNTTGHQQYHGGFSVVLPDFTSANAYSARGIMVEFDRTQNMELFPVTWDHLLYTGAFQQWGARVVLPPDISVTTMNGALVQAYDFFVPTNFTFRGFIKSA